MNSNLPIPIEPQTVPYVRPHDEKKRRARRLTCTLGILAAAVCMVIACICLSSDDGFFGFLPSADETTSEETTAETTTAPTLPTDIYNWSAELPQGATAILPRDLSANTVGLFADNPTDAVLESVMPAFPKKAKDGISVLIVNTHAFESYAREGMLYYTDTAFSSNAAQDHRISAAAHALCEALNENGIGAIFVDCMTESAFGSYQNAKKMVELTLEDHPEIVLILDLHRGILTDETGALLRPITQISDAVTAQIRILLGTGGNWETHASAALSFYETANLTYSSLMMPLTVSENTFLQTCSVPVLTLEIGTAGNTVAEALVSAEMLANVLNETMRD